MYRVLIPFLIVLPFIFVASQASAQVPENVQPTFHCLAAPCPVTPSVANPQTTNNTTTISSSPQNRTATNPNSYENAPCDNSASGITDHTNKHKKNKNGNVGNSVDNLLKKIIELLEKLVKVLGGETSPSSSRSNTPKSVKKPCDEPKQKKQAIKPATNTPAASKAPTSSPSKPSSSPYISAQPSSKPSQPSIQPSSQPSAAPLQPAVQPSAAAAAPNNAGINCTGTECAFKFITKYVRISSKYGPRGGRIHKGTDLAGPRGTPIKALENGVILQSKQTPDAGTGYGVEMKDDNGRKHYYMHFAEKSNVTVGQRVKRGDQIGLMDSTGNSTGDHLHFQITKPNSLDYIDAEQELTKWPQY